MRYIKVLLLLIKLIFQNLLHVPMIDSLFYTPVSIEDGPTLKALIDSGSMASTISEGTEDKLLEANPNLTKTLADNVIVVGCHSLCLWM